MKNQWFWDYIFTPFFYLVASMVVVMATALVGIWIWVIAVSTVPFAKFLATFVVLLVAPHAWKDSKEAIKDMIEFHRDNKEFKKIEKEIEKM